MNFIKIKVEEVTEYKADEIEAAYERIPYYEKEEGWFVNTRKVDGNDEWRQFTNSGGELDLRQLLKKEYDIRY